MQQNIAHCLDEKQRSKDVLLEENVTFASLLLSSEIKKGLSDGGFKKPSPIQFKAIPLGRCGFDLIVKSKSGTGKTLVFSTIALETANVNKEHLQVLILVPTREIAVQIQDVLRCIGRCIEGLSIESFIGGTPLEADIKKAKRCHIAVGAPGRVKHLITLGALDPKNVKLFVLDEADKLMEAAFQNDINEIFDILPPRKQLIATSATYPQELDTFLANYMLSPTHVTSENETPLLLGLRQFVAVIKSTAINPVQQMKAKNDILLEIFSKVSFTQCLVFTNYQSRTESVCNFLNQKGWNSSFISAAVAQAERLEAIKDLKNFKNRILLSTDLTSRGIDAPNVDLVINYDLPVDAVTYLHRMGRAGRYGSAGMCINFALEGTEIKKMQNILGTIGATKLSVSKLPPLNGTDLWQLDPKNLEQIWGVVPAEGEVSESIKEEVLMLKQQKSKKGKKKIKKEKVVEEKVEDQEEIMNGLNGDDLLNFLVTRESNCDDDSKKRKRGVAKEELKMEDLFSEEKVQDIFNKTKIPEDSIKSLVDVDGESLLASLVTKFDKNEDETKKRKLNEPPKKSESKNNKEITFSRNRGLLSITKLLYDSSIQIDEDIIDSIDGFLTILKQDYPDDNSKSTEEILMFDNHDNIKTEEVTLNVDTLEDIFRIGYQHLVKNERTWFTYLKHEEFEQFQEFCRRDQAISSESEENEDEEENEDYEMEEYPSNDAEESNVALQWVPVVQEETNSQQDHFEKYYEDCSNVLWQTGLTFETVPEFDEWFYQWQQQLQSVRNYVQQNIYVEEMSEYQQNKLTNK